MLVLKFILGLLIGIMMVVYEYGPAGGQPAEYGPAGGQPAEYGPAGGTAKLSTGQQVDNRPSKRTFLITRDAAVYALFAASLFLVAIIPTGKKGDFNRVLRSFIQLSGTFATFLAALQLLEGTEQTFTEPQLIAVWLVIIVALIAGAISFVVTVFGPWFGRFPK